MKNIKTRVSENGESIYTYIAAGSGLFRLYPQKGNFNFLTLTRPSKAEKELFPEKISCFYITRFKIKTFTYQLTDWSNFVFQLCF